MRIDDRDMELPPEAVEIALRSMAEIVGEDGARVILRQAGMLDYLNDGKVAAGVTPRFGDVGKVIRAMMDIYGEKGAAATLKRTGRVQFHSWREAYPTAIGMAGVALKALPSGKRLKFVLKAVAVAANHLARVRIEVEDGTDGGLVFRTWQSPYSSGLESEHPVCHTAVGALEEVSQWSTGQRWPVTETACRAQGADACTFVFMPPEPESG